jgi:hypothetical protein
VRRWATGRRSPLRRTGSFVAAGTEGRMLCTGRWVGDLRGRGSGRRRVLVLGLGRTGLGRKGAGRKARLGGWSWLRRPRCKGLRRGWGRGRVPPGWRFGVRWGSRRPRWRVLAGRCRRCSGDARSSGEAGRNCTGSAVAVTTTFARASAACRRRVPAVPMGAGRSAAASAVARAAAVALVRVVGSAGSEPRHLLRRTEPARILDQAAGSY